jgi:hypothetical protein
MVLRERRSASRRRAGPFFRIIQTLESNAHWSSYEKCTYQLGGVQCLFHPFVLPYNQLAYIKMVALPRHELALSAFLRVSFSNQRCHAFQALCLNKYAPWPNKCKQSDQISASAVTKKFKRRGEISAGSMANYFVSCCKFSAILSSKLVEHQ